MDTPATKPEGSAEAKSKSLVPDLRQRPSEHAVNIIKAAFQAVPFVGSPIGSLMDDYLPNSTQRAVKELARQVAIRLEALEYQFSEESISKRMQSEDFIEIFKRSLRVVSMTNRELKIKAVAALMVESLKPDSDEQRLAFDETDFLIRCVDSLSMGALELLLRLETQFAGGSRIRLEIVSLDGLTNSAKDRDLRVGFAEELSRFHLIHIQRGDTGYEPGMYPVYNITVTVLGEDFARRMKSDPKSLTTDSQGH